MKIPSIQKCIEILNVMCINSKINYTIRFNSYDKNYTVKVLGKGFYGVRLPDALIKAIKYVSIAEDYATKEQWNENT